MAATRRSLALIDFKTVRIGPALRRDLRTAAGIS
jgi:hypothetical protein